MACVLQKVFPDRSYRQQISSGPRCIIRRILARQTAQQCAVVKNRMRGSKQKTERIGMPNVAVFYIVWRWRSNKTRGHAVQKWAVRIEVTWIFSNIPFFK